MPETAIEQNRCYKQLFMGYLKDYKEKFLNGEEIPSEIIDLVLESLKDDLENNNEDLSF